MTDPDNLVSVYKAANPIEAHLVMNLLTDAGMRAVVSEENDPLAGLPIAAPDVLVATRDEAEARKIVAEYEKEQFDRVESGEALEDDYPEEEGDDEDQSE